MDTFQRDQRGTVAILFGASIFAITGLTALAVDFARAYNEKSVLQQATDAAALAGAALHDGDTEQRIAVATAHFMVNYNSKTGSTATPLVQVSGSRVTVSATATLPTAFARVIGFDTLEVPSESEADVAQSSPMNACLLALNPSAASGIRLVGDARLVAPNCWVWSNSTLSESISGGGTAQGSAAGFCAAGGVYGGSHFAPSPRSGCPPIPDPYANLVAPWSGSCTATDLSFGPGAHNISPGTYCGGIRVQSSANVSFAPGTYVIKDGPLIFLGQSISAGNGVTFYFTGASSGQAGLQVAGGAAVDFKAPATGDLAGFVFVQHRYSQPGSTSSITGGARVKLEGILYMPTWIVDVAGNGLMFEEALSWTLVADRFIIRGTGDIIVRADPVAAAFPSNLPQARTWVARLTK